MTEKYGLTKFETTGKAMALFGAKFDDKELRKRSSTARLEIERRRMELEKATAFVDTVLEKLLDKENPPSREEAEKYVNIANLMGMSGFLKGVGLMVDCVSKREKVTNKAGEVSYRRITVASVVDEVGDMLFHGVFSRQDLSLEMLNDLGLHFKAFLDDNGVFNADKYFSDKKEDGDETDIPEPSVEEVGETVTEAELEAAKQKPNIEVILGMAKK